MNLIQKLESDISQAAEYGGIPNYYSRAELRKFLAALIIGQLLCDNLEEALEELLAEGPSSKDEEYLDTLNQWKAAIKL